MKDLAGKTAVITGAASGMGRAFADRFARAGMHVVMSDIEAPRLDEAEAQVARHGTGVVGVVTDVGDEDSMDGLGAATLDAFGPPHVVCNNAGVAGSLGGDGRIDAANWRWVLDVNLWGVVHGHRVFLPMLVEQGEGHIVNTASMAGHLPGHSPYSASKWAVVGMTLGLYHQMNAQGTGVGVSCLCPGWVRTDINRSDRNRPEWATPRVVADPTPAQEMRQAFLDDVIASGMPPDEVADLVHDAVVDETFWIFTDLDMVAMLADKHASIVENRNPAPPRLPGA
jgi:NAD(P)-dependent dehydrogenase (short-subunit alcohol dehydrogenase family)